MPPRRRTSGELLDLLGLPASKPGAPSFLRRHLRAALRLLPRRERYLLRLLHVRGATQAELAGALGIDRNALRRILRRAQRRATDPLNLAILGVWHRLTPAEQRLAYLHRFLGMSLRRIAALGLVPASGGVDRPPRPAGFKGLRGILRRVRRKIRRWGRAPGAYGSTGSAPATADGSGGEAG